MPHERQLWLAILSQRGLSTPEIVIADLIQQKNEDAHELATRVRRMVERLKKQMNTRGLYAQIAVRRRRAK